MGKGILLWLIGIGARSKLPSWGKAFMPYPLAPQWLR